MKLCIFFILIFLLLPPLFAQEADSGVEEVTIPRKMKIFLDVSGDLKADEYLLLSESLLIKLSETKDLVVVEPVVDENIPSGDEALSAFCSGAGADCWLLIKIEAGEKELKLILTSYDLFEKKYIYNKEVVSKDRKLRGLDRSFWRSIISHLEDNYNSIVEVQNVVEVTKIVKKEEIVVEKRGVSLTFTGVPGAVISGIGDSSLVIGEEGSVKVEVPGYTTYSVKVQLKGYYPTSSSFYLEKEEKVVELNMKHASWMGADVYFQNVDYIGIGLFGLFLSNKLWVEASGTFYQQKLLWPVTENRELYNLDLIQVFMSVGYYFLPENSLIRPGVSVGGFAQLTTLGTGKFMLNPLSPAGIKLFGAHVEIRAWEKVRPYVEYASLLYFTEEGSQMEASLSTGDTGNDLKAGYLFFDKATIDLLNFKVGVRVYIP